MVSAQLKLIGVSAFGAEPGHFLYTGLRGARHGHGIVDNNLVELSYLGPQGGDHEMIDLGEVVFGGGR